MNYPKCPASHVAYFMFLVLFAGCSSTSISTTQSSFDPAMREMRVSVINATTKQPVPNASVIIVAIKRGSTREGFASVGSTNDRGFVMIPWQERQIHHVYVKGEDFHPQKIVLESSTNTLPTIQLKPMMTKEYWASGVGLVARVEDKYSGPEIEMLAYMTLKELEALGIVDLYSNLDGPRDIVNTYCTLYFLGIPLLNDSSLEEISTLVEWVVEPDWRRAIIVEDFQILDVHFSQDHIEVIVAFNILGELSDDWEKTSELKQLTFIVRESRDGLRISSPSLPPHVSPEAMLHYLNLASEQQLDQFQGQLEHGIPKLKEIISRRRADDIPPR